MNIYQLYRKMTSIMHTSSVPTSSVPTSSVPTSSVPTSSVPTSSVPTSLADPRLSIYIPFVLSNWASPHQIADIFYRLNIGVVKRVDFTRQHSGGYQARVYFAYWFNNQITYNLQEQILKPDGAKIVYDDPRYWRLLPNNRYNSLYIVEAVDEQPTCYECDDPHNGACKNENYYEGKRYFEQFCA
jgi:hypothetical protein